MKNPPSFALPKRTAYSAIRFILLTLQDLSAKSRKWYPSSTGTRNILPASHCQPCRSDDFVQYWLLCHWPDSADSHQCHFSSPLCLSLEASFDLFLVLILPNKISTQGPLSLLCGNNAICHVSESILSLCKKQDFFFVLDTLIQFSIKAACAAVSHLTSGCWELF